MIKKLTVFVLGAGASAHLGFPTAQELRRLILHNTKPRPADPWIERKIDDEQRNEFRRLFQTSVPSIDAFLQLHPRFEQLGKLAIAEALIPREQDGVLWRHTELNRGKDWNSSNWYEYLFTLLSTGARTADDFWKNKFYVVTFNYDRSLEHYLATCVCSSYGADYSDAVKRMSAHVFHVHGTIAPLGNAASDREYRVDLNPEIILNAASYIKVMHDKPVIGAGLIAADRLAKASRVFFLGFGYSLDNLARINWPRVRPGGRAWGTSVGLEPGEVKSINEKFSIDFQPHGAREIEPLLRNLMPASVDH